MRKEKLKGKAKIAEVDGKTAILSSGSNSWFLKLIKKIDKPLANSIEKKVGKSTSIQIRNNKGEITIETGNLTNHKKLFCRFYAN